MSTANAPLDPYTAQAEKNNVSLQEKINREPHSAFLLLIPHLLLDLKEIIESSKTAMLTTRAEDGQLHSRAMNPLARMSSSDNAYNHSFMFAAKSDTELTLSFFANNVTHKFDEIEQDPHVNVNFSNFSTTAWASWVFISLTGVNLLKCI